MNFLALDTSTDTGLVVLKFNNKTYARVQQEPREHNRFLLAMIAEVLEEANIDLSALDAFICGNGPGSFVGVRLGIAVMQGLAYATKKPVYALSSLALQAQAFFRIHPKHSEILIAHDARMQALYLGQYRNNNGIAERVGSERLIRVEELPSLTFDKELRVSGNAAQLLPQQIAILGTPPLKAEDLEIQALACISPSKALSAYTLQPVYLNDEINWRKI